VQLGGASLAVSALEIVECLANGGHYSSPSAIRAIARTVAAAFRPWPAAVQALRAEHNVSVCTLSCSAVPPPLGSHRARSSQGTWLYPYLPPACPVPQGEVAALEERCLVLRTKLYSTVLDLKVDAKLAAFVRNALSSNVIVDDVDPRWGASPPP
jgi:hypothetical protein